MGADRVILYKEEDFVEAAKSAGGADVILDMVAGDYFERNIQALAPKGRLVQIATLHGAEVKLDIRKVMAKNLTITGSMLRPRPVAEKARIAAELEENIWPLLNAGKMKPLIYKILPLEKASEAHAMMEASQHTGKIVLKIR